MADANQKEIRTSIKFAVDLEKDNVTWFYQREIPDLTEQQALVVSTTKLVGAVNDVASGLYSISDALNNIAAALRERES